MDRNRDAFELSKSCASYLSSQNVNHPNVGDYIGWTRGSKIAARYVAVFGTENERQIAKAYGHESKFQNELQDFLDAELNAGGGGGFGLNLGGGEERVVERESGRARADIVVNQTVGIEMKRDLSNSQTKKLRGQIEEYLDEYPYVIVCACGIQNMDGWRRLKNKYSGGGGGFGLEGGVVNFVHKDPDYYGQDPGSSGGHGGGLDPFSLDF